MLPFPLKTMAGLTVCDPEAFMHNCSVACHLSNPDEGWDTHTCFDPPVSYVFSWPMTNGRGT